MNKSESIKELAQALLLLQGEIGKATKDAKNPFFNSKYSTLEAVSDVSRKPLQDNGLIITQTVDETQFSTHSTYDHFKKGELTNTDTIIRNSIVVETTLIHAKTGEYITSRIPIFNSKDDMQGMGSAITYARRYGLAGILGIVQEDDDANSTKKTYKEPAKPELDNGDTVIAKINASTDPTKLENAYNIIKEHKAAYTKSGFEAITKAYNKKMIELLEGK